ncbi:MAG: cell wall hydrolase [Bacillota bacterium]
MKKLLSLLICIFLITGGSTEATDNGKGANGTGKESPTAVMLSESALDPLLKPSTINQLGVRDDLEEEEKDAADTGTAASTRHFAAEDLDLLARLVQAEAGGEPYKGKVAVAASVLNRVESDRYPSTIPGVIYQVAYGYQYCPVRNGTINRPAGDEARRAVQEALQGNDPTGGALSFYNPAKATNAWIRTQPVHTRIGNHLFVR